MRKILIVDDEESLTKALERIFREYYEVACANDGEDALRQIKEYNPELIILDWRLKGTVEGRDVLLFLKCHYPEIIVCVFTASIHLQKEIRSLGADECFFKPPTLDFEDRIKQILPCDSAA